MSTSSNRAKRDMYDGLTPAGYTPPLFREPEADASARALSQIEQLLHPSTCVCLVCDPVWAREVEQATPARPARLFWVTASLGGASTFHAMRATDDELCGATEHAEVMMRLADLLAERAGIDADDVFVTGAVHYGDATS